MRREGMTKRLPREEMMMEARRRNHDHRRRKDRRPPPVTAIRPRRIAAIAARRRSGGVLERRRLPAGLIDFPLEHPNPLRHGLHFGLLRSFPRRGWIGRGRVPKRDVAYDADGLNTFRRRVIAVINDSAGVDPGIVNYSDNPPPKGVQAI